MTPGSPLDRLLQSERVNFIVTNRIPRRTLSRFLGWFSRIEQPLVRDLSIAVWRFFADDLNLQEARKTRFASLHDCFVRELKQGARPIDGDPLTLVSPCDAVVGALGRVRDGELLQAKGHAYSLEELLGEPEEARRYVGGHYVTLRLKSSMYHRFHAPHDCRVERVSYFPGDAWNVNPTALRRVDRLYCRNERVAIRTTLRESGHVVTLVPVAAVLVASIRLHFLDLLLHQRYRGPEVIACAADLAKGQEMGWFEHGSTLLVLSPAGLAPCDSVMQGGLIRVGEPLLRLP